MIHWAWLVPPPTLATPGMDGNSEQQTVGQFLATGLLIGFHWWKSLLQQTKTVCVSLIIGANYGWVKILNNRLHDSHTQSPIAATMPFSKTNVSTINPKIVNSQHSPSCMNRNDVTINQTTSHKVTQNVTNYLQIITHLCALTRVRKIPTKNANPWTTVQLLQSFLTTTNLQQFSLVYTCYSPMLLTREDSQCDRACVAVPHTHQQQCFACNPQRDQEYSFRSLQGIAAVR